MEIIRGKQNRPQKIVIYGPEGIGKSTLAANFPDPLFIDTEGSTSQLDVARFQNPSSWQMLKDQVAYVIKNRPCKTLVIDTVDWAEYLCIEQVLAKHQKTGIEEFGYGNGYTYVREEFGRFLNLLQDVIEAGIHVVLTAHSQIKKFEQPDEMGAYDRYELKLGKKTSSQTAPLVKEWADMVLFCNYKTYSIAVDEKGKKYKAQGGKRVMYTQHHSCWDAKNRHNLPAEMEMTYEGIAHIFLNNQVVTTSPVPTVKNHTPAEQEKSPTPPQLPEPKQEQTSAEPITEPTPVQETSEMPEGVPRALWDLMQAANATIEEVQAVVAQKGYYPADTPISNYEDGFIQGVLIGAWPQVLKMIQDNKQDSQEDLPF